MSGNKYPEPNYFFAVRTYNKSIHRKMREVQGYVKHQKPILQECFTSPDKLHLTLFVMTLADNSDIRKAIEAMRHSAPLIGKLLTTGEPEAEVSLPLKLQFQNLKSFGGKIVYIDVVKNESLSVLRNIISIMKQSFRHVGLRFKGGSWTPQLTVMKMSKCLETMEEAGIRQIESRFYRKYAGRVFGSDTVEDIVLCSMNENELEPDGFYEMIAKIDFKDPRDVSVHTRRKISKNVVSSSRSPKEMSYKDMLCANK